MGQLKGTEKSSVEYVFKRSATYQGIDEDFTLQNPRVNGTLGLLAIIIACISSGLAGVYFVLKEYNMRSGRSGTRTRMSLWVRNVQLSLFSIFPALFIGVLFKDGEEVTRYGFFTGYNWFVWTIVVLQACRGVLVALVINYSNNIAKNFATGISIVISFVASIFCFDLSITFQVSVSTGDRSQVAANSSSTYSAPAS